MITEQKHRSQIHLKVKITGQEGSHCRGYDAFWMGL